MSPVSKWLLVAASFFFAGAFIWVAIYAGHLSQKGPAPFYVLAAICGIAGILLLRVRSIPFEDGPKPIGSADVVTASVVKPSSSPHPTPSLDPDDASVYDVDLTKITAAGCLLCLSSVIVLLIAGGMVAVIAPDLIAERATQKLTGGIIFGVVAAYFIAGRFVLKKLGFTFMRKS